jgi:hypothetical protein
MVDSAAPASRRSTLWRLQIGLGCSAEDLEQRRSLYQEYLEQHPFPALLEDSEATAARPEGTGFSISNSFDPDAALDPLTAILLEEQTLAQQQHDMDLEYRKALARRKRIPQQQRYTGTDEEDLSVEDRNLAALQIIDKDLHRLGHPSGDADFDGTQRKEVLRQVLYVFHCRHESIGYRQGMHEIASWLLWSLECDEDEDADEKQLSSDAAAECYFMTETVVTDIQAAFDVGENRPMEQMSRRVVAEVTQTDLQLWERLENLHIPPAIYLTKWIRLLFSREVIDVMGLWDAMFAAKQEGFSWMRILEAAAAARLLQHRVDFVLCSEDTLLNLLMNLPPEQDIDPLLEFLHALLREDHIALPPISLPRATVNYEAPAQEQIQTQSSNITSNPLFSKQVVGSLAAHLSGVKNTIAAQTQTFSKRLQHEWENIQNENNQSALRSYDDGFWSQSLAGTVDPYSFSSPPTLRTSPNAQDHSGANTTYSPTRMTYPPHTWAYEMEHRLCTLQNFVMLSEQHYKGSVPPGVWEALADLEDIRQAILRTHSQR